VSSRHLIVAGFHRSGTSLVSRLLERAGLFLGYELLGATPWNPHGHFEDAEIMRLHDEVLADNGASWRIEGPFLPVINDAHWRRMRSMVERRDSEHRLWGFKDPRVCLFMMLWKHLLPDARVLLVYRHFADSTHSLGRRESSLLFSKQDRQQLSRVFWREPDLALRMWLGHNEALLAFARAYPEDTLAVSFEMVRSGFPLVRAINQRWDLGLREVAASEVFDPGAINRRSGRQPVSDRRLIPRVEETWHALEDLSSQTARWMAGDSEAG
jgi:hypothetical protein